jgi:hypothetical protein
MGAGAHLEDATVSVEAGGAASVALRVRNTGQVVDQFTFEVLGVAAGWTSAEPPSISLFPNAEEATSLWFRPPRSPSLPAGEVPFGIRVLSREDPAGSVVEEGVVEVGAFRQTTAELTPRNSRALASGSHELAVDNRGNVSIEVTMTGGDPDQLLRVRPRPATMVVVPGAAGFSRIRARGRGLFLSGPPRSFPFQVQVAPAGEAPIALDASFVQVPLFGRWLRRVAMAVGLGAAALVALWFLAAKPAVESTAKDSVATPLAQQSAAIAQLQKEVPQSASGTGAGATAGSPGGQAAAGAAAGASSGTGSSGPGATGAAGSTGNAAGAGGAAVAHRLDHDHAQYQVTSGGTLAITDVVFQNPGSQHGTVQLVVDGNTLLEENLDNFRDEDFHVVTAVVARKSVQMSVQCPGSGCSGAAILLVGTEKGG